MKTITVGQLRQNPTRALDEVEAGATYRITRHDHEIGRIVPAGSSGDVLPPRKRGSRLVERPRHELTTAPTVEELLDELRGDV